MHAHQSTDQLVSKYNTVVYALYDKPSVALCDDGCLQLAFRCARPGCKRLTPVNRYEHHQSGPDNSSTGGLVNHVRSCWGSEKYEEISESKTKDVAEEKVKCTKQGTLTFLFGAKDGKFRFSFQNHTLIEVWYV